MWMISNSRTEWHSIDIDIDSVTLHVVCVYDIDKLYWPWYFVKDLVVKLLLNTEKQLEVTSAALVR